MTIEVKITHTGGPRKPVGVFRRLEPGPGEQAVTTVMPDGTETVVLWLGGELVLREMEKLSEPKDEAAA